MPAVRAAVYNAHWTTLGAVSSSPVGVAAAPGAHPRRRAAGRRDLRPIVASERLGFDLTGFPQVPVEHGTRAFLEASARYDLVVNTSFGNTFASRAPRNLYYVHFPMPNSIRTPIEAATWPFASINPLAPGWNASTGSGCGSSPATGTWTKGDATIDLVVPRGVRLPFSLSLSARAVAGRA